MYRKKSCQQKRGTRRRRKKMFVNERKKEKKKAEMAKIVFWQNRKLIYGSVDVKRYIYAERNRYECIQDELEWGFLSFSGLSKCNFFFVSLLCRWKNMYIISMQNANC